MMSHNCMLSNDTHIAGYNLQGLLTCGNGENTFIGQAAVSEQAYNGYAVSLVRFSSGQLMGFSCTLRQICMSRFRSTGNPFYKWGVMLEQANTQHCHLIYEQSYAGPGNTYEKGSVTLKKSRSWAIPYIH